VSLRSDALRLNPGAFPIRVQIEQEEAVEVSMTTDPDLGTIYSVAVPVKRVLPTARAGLAEDVAEQGVTSVEWEADKWDADPAARFPWGT